MWNGGWERAGGRRQLGISNGPDRAGWPYQVMPVDSQRAGQGRNLISFKAHDQPTDFILGGLDEPRWRDGRAQG